LEIPGLIESRMVACLDNTRVEVDVSDVLIGCRVAKKYSSELVVVKFGASLACPLNANTRSKDSEAGEVGFVAKVALKRGTFGVRVDKSVIEVHRVSESVGPILSGKARTVEQ
jgi:hypothetical protein